MPGGRCTKCKIGILTTENDDGVLQVRCESCGALTFLRHTGTPQLPASDSSNSSASALFALALPRLPETLRVYRLLEWLRQHDIESWTLERVLDALEDAGYRCYKAGPKWTLMASRQQKAMRTRELVSSTSAL